MRKIEKQGLYERGHVGRKCAEEVVVKRSTDRFQRKRGCIATRTSLEIHLVRRALERGDPDEHKCDEHGHLERYPEYCPHCKSEHTSP